jgi:hypothetical protein
MIIEIPSYPSSHAADAHIGLSEVVNYADIVSYLTKTSFCQISIPNSLRSQYETYPTRQH